MKRHNFYRKLCWIICAVIVFAFASPAFAGTYHDTITSVLDTYESSNSSSSGAPQQLVNGSYRTVELLAIAALLLDE